MRQRGGDHSSTPCRTAHRHPGEVRLAQLEYDLPLDVVSLGLAIARYGGPSVGILFHRLARQGPAKHLLGGTPGAVAVDVDRLDAAPGGNDGQDRLAPRVPAVPHRPVGHAPDYGCPHRDVVPFQAHAEGTEFLVGVDDVRSRSIVAPRPLDDGAERHSIELEEHHLDIAGRGLHVREEDVYPCHRLRAVVGLGGREPRRSRGGHPDHVGDGVDVRHLPGPGRVRRRPVGEEVVVPSVRRERGEPPFLVPAIVQVLPPRPRGRRQAVPGYRPEVQVRSRVE